ncbi:MAG: biosynthetic-type acetolactate synthase large subunit [Coriobacteriales bacterium]|jgi:acetolactate synthase-1/2/3 large subunit|nr:biosynthetic-type acetolactate synthase large subunit [Coriobacteriales bacterium]
MTQTTQAQVQTQTAQTQEAQTAQMANSEATPSSEQRPQLTGAEIVARILLEQGATSIFGYPGGAVLAIYDALYEHRDEITHYLTAHEQGAAHAADGYARATGKVGVVLATSGPGSTNLVTGIATAFMDSVPLVIITGNVSSAFIGKDSFQEVYTTGITLPITKHNFFVQDVRELAPALREAFAIASSGRKGPVLIDITKDAQAACCDFEPATAPSSMLNKGDEDGTVAAFGSPATDVTDATPSAAATSAILAYDIDSILAEISASHRPLVIFGGGVVSADASTQLRDFLRATGIPAVHSIMGTGVLSFDDPLNCGLVGMHGATSGNRALAETDLLIALGFRFSDRVALNTERWASQARIIHIDIDPSEIDKNIRVDRALVGDVREVLQALLSRIRAGALGAEGVQGALPGADRAAWLTIISEWRANDYRPEDAPSASAGGGAANGPGPTATEATPTLMPHQIIEAIAELAGPEAIITTDVGQHQMWAAQFSRQTRPRSFLTSGGLGAMGFGYGAAIGAQIGAGGGPTRTRPVIHITGDGSFHMNLNEACTAVSYRLPIITVIFNNRALGMVRQLQKVFYDAHYCATTLDRLTDYVKVAEGFGLMGMRTATIADFRAALVRALNTEGPVWIECVIDRDAQVLPMIPVGGDVTDTIVD